MKLVPVALYIGDLEGAPTHLGIRRRHRKKGLSTQVECGLEPKDVDVFLATPLYRPEGPRRASFRLQLRVPLVGGTPDEEFALAIQPVHETRTTDPEQSILSPIYSGPDRLIFEFVRAEVVWSLRNGNAGVRFAAIDGATGRVGTRDRPLDSGLYRSLLDRCRGQLAGDPLLFPPRQDLHRKPTRIPRGLPLLDFPGN